MADDAIIQDVILKGQDDIKAGFASIERAGLQMFNSLQAASELSGFAKLTLSIASVAAGLVGVTAGMFKWAESSAKGTVELGHLADQMGTTSEDASSFISALNVGSVNLAEAFKRMAVRIENVWPEIQKSQRQAANLIIADNLAIQNSYLALERAQVQLGNASKTISLQQVANSNSVRGAELSLAEALEKGRIAAGGAADPEFDERIAKQKISLAIDQARLALAEAQKKASEDAILSANKLAQSAIDVESAKLKLAQDIDKAAEDSKNSIANLTKFVDNLAKGVADAGLNVNKTAENVIKGLIASVGPAGEALQGLKGTFTSVADAPPVLKDVLLKLADVFHNTEDNALKTAIAVSLFGRGVGQDMVKELSKGSAAILEEQKRIEALGLVLTKADQIVSENLTHSLTKLGDRLSIVSKQFGLTFAPTFTAIVKEITATVENSSGSFKKFGEMIEQSVTPAIAGFIKAVTGIDVAKNLDLSEGGKKSVESWQKTFDAIISVVKTGASIIGGVLSTVVDLINSAFGSQLSVSEAGILAFSVFAVARFSKIAAAILVVIGVLDQLNKRFGSEALTEDSNFSTIMENRRLLIASELANNKLNTEEFRKQKTELEGMQSQFDKLSKAGDTEGAERLRKQLLQPFIDTGTIKKATTEASSSADDMAKRIGENADKVGQSVDKVAAKITGIGDAAKTSLQGVKTLTDGIKLLDATKGFNQPSGVQSVDANKAPFQQQLAGAIPTDARGIQALPALVVDTSKSFGQLAIDAKKATDEIDQSLERLAGIGEKSIDIDKLEKSLASLAEPASVFETRWSEATKKTLADLGAIEKIELPKITPNVDLSEFGKLAELENSTVQLFKDMDTKIVGFFKALPDQIAKEFSGIGDDISKALGPGIESVKKFPEEIAKLFTGFADSISPALSGIGESLSKVFSGGQLQASIGALQVQVVKLLSDLLPKGGIDFSSLGDSLKKSFDGALEFLGGIPGKVVGFFSDLPSQIAFAISGLGDALRTPFSGFLEFVGGIPDKVAEFFSGIPSQVGSALSGLGEAISAPFNTAAQAISTAWQGVIQFFTTLPSTIGSLVSSVTESIVSPFRSAADQIISALQPVLDFIGRIKDSISGINVPTAPSGGGGSGFAEGGQFRGKPGIDTNLAWLTDKEFIHPVVAVEQFGLDFMEMVRRLDVAGVVRWASRFSAPKFNAGGLVRWMNDFTPPTLGGISQMLNHNLSPIRIPAFAGGGLNVSPQGNQFGGGGSDGGHMTVDLRTDRGTFRVLAPPNTAKELNRLSVSERLASAGPPPNWVGRRGR